MDEYMFHFGKYNDNQYSCEFVFNYAITWLLHLYIVMIYVHILLPNYPLVFQFRLYLGFASLELFNVDTTFSLTDVYAYSIIHVCNQNEKCIKVKRIYVHRFSIANIT